MDRTCELLMKQRSLKKQSVIQFLYLVYFHIQMQQTCDMLGDDEGSNEKSVIILLVFLASQLIGRKKLASDTLIYHIIHPTLQCACADSFVDEQDQQNLRRILQWKNLREESFASNKQQQTIVNNLHQEGLAFFKFLMCSKNSITFLDCAWSGHELDYNEIFRKGCSKSAIPFPRMG